ncbi:MAG: phosphate ABC transporter permease subunit PstC [Desulfobacteraceae bacterium]
MITPSTLLFLLLLLCLTAYYLGLRRSVAVAGGRTKIHQLHSRPAYYGMLTALWCAIPAFTIFFCWQAFEGNIITSWVVSGLPQELKSLPADRINLIVNDIRNLVDGNIISGQVSPAMRAAADQYRRIQHISDASLAVATMAVAIICLVWVRQRIQLKMRARNHVERLVLWILGACSTVAIFTTIGIVLSVLYEAIRFFQTVSPFDFLFGLEWSPQMAIREDQVGSSGAFGAVPVIAGTMLISGIAMVVAVPIGLMSAIYMSEYAGKKFRSAAKPLMEILAGIPTVVYGYFAALVLAPTIRAFGQQIGLDVSSESALAAGLVMGIMIIPFVSSLSDDMINAVPQELRDGAYGLGATQAETIRQVVLPAALPGIVGGVLLAISRAIGETMIVVMAAGLTANMTVNPLKTVTTVTVQIVTLLVGDQEFDSPKTLAAFALGLLLFISTLCLNIIALQVVRKYREQYE